MEPIEIFEYNQLCKPIEDQTSSNSKPYKLHVNILGSKRKFNIIFSGLLKIVWYREVF